MNTCNFCGAQTRHGILSAGWYRIEVANTKDQRIKITACTNAKCRQKAYEQANDWIGIKRDKNEIYAEPLSA